MKTVPEQIREIIIESGLTQTAIAHILNITPACLCNYKKGIRPIRAEQFERMKMLVQRKSRRKGEKSSPDLTAKEF